PIAEQPPAHFTARERLAWTLAVVFAVAAAVALALLLARPKTVDDRVLRYALQAPSPEHASLLPRAHSRLTPPDRRRLRVLGGGGGRSPIWIRDLDSTTARVLPGTENASSLFWSPDSRLLGFFTNSGRTLKKIDPSGAPATTVCDLPGQAW